MIASNGFTAAAPPEAGWNGRGMDALGLVCGAAAKTTRAHAADEPAWGWGRRSSRAFHLATGEAPSTSGRLPRLVEGAHLSPRRRLPGDLFDVIDDDTDDYQHDDYQHNDTDRDDGHGEHSPAGIDHELLESVRL